MAEPVCGAITVGYDLRPAPVREHLRASRALYTRYADNNIDPEATELKAEVERLDALRGAHPTHTSDAELVQADLSTGA